MKPRTAAARRRAQARATRAVAAVRRWERALSLSLDDLDGAAAGRVQHAWAQLRAREAYRAYFAKGRA